MLPVLLQPCSPATQQSPYGGAINGQEQGGHLNVHRSRFFNNSASDKGGAIHVENRRFTLSAYDTVFDANQVRWHPSIHPRRRRCQLKTGRTVSGQCCFSCHVIQDAASNACLLLPHS
jgi:predicted outer membrane repeat protein